MMTLPVGSRGWMTWWTVDAGGGGRGRAYFGDELHLPGRGPVTGTAAARWACPTTCSSPPGRIYASLSSSPAGYARPDLRQPVVIPGRLRQADLRQPVVMPDC